MRDRSRPCAVLFFSTLLIGGCQPPDQLERTPPPERGGNGPTATASTETAAPPKQRPASERAAPQPVDETPPQQEDAAPGADGEAAPSEQLDQSNPAAADATPPAPFRPSWWHAEPIVEAGRLWICARAEASTLAEANRAAVAAGMQILRRELTAREATDVADTLAASRTETVAADLAVGGRWQGFVRLSAPLPGRP
jgi:hypothetical protein